MQAKNSFNPNHSKATHILIKINELISNNFQIQLCWIPAHVGVRGNEEADQAAKAAITCPPYQTHLPIQDCLTTLYPAIITKWQTEWQVQPPTVKLRHIKPHVYRWPSSYHNIRKIEVILTRLRIGHTRLTHGYLMSNPQQPHPECDTCKVRLSLHHIIFNMRQILQITSTIPT